MSEIGWSIQGRELTENDIDGYAGMVYLIENLTNNKKYIGKKAFRFSRRRKVKGRLRRVLVKSDYLTYYGSCAELLDDVKSLGVESFSRTVLRLCENKAQMTYWEGFYQMKEEVLLREDFYNMWITVKVRRSKALGARDE